MHLLGLTMQHIEENTCTAVTWRIPIERQLVLLFIFPLQLRTDPIPIGSMFTPPNSSLQHLPALAAPPHHQLTLQVQGCELFSDELLINNNKRLGGHRQGSISKEGENEGEQQGGFETEGLIWSGPHHYHRPSDTITSALRSPALQTAVSASASDIPPLSSATYMHTRMCTHIHCLNRQLDQ